MAGMNRSINLGNNIVVTDVRELGPWSSAVLGHSGWQQSHRCPV